MNYYDQLASIAWDDVNLSIYSKSANDVRKALLAEQPTLEDFKALISPAAEPFLEQMAVKSQQITRTRFGNTMSLYIPLYLSNLCANVCTYCGFSMDNRIKRKVLTVEEIEKEVDVIVGMKFDSVLLVTGEHETKVGLEYFKQVVPVIKKRINYVALEVQPMQQQAYQELVSLGVDAVMVYQETYHPSTYAQHHLRGNKRDFEFRVNTPDRLARAGVKKIGLGALIGLEDWRVDTFLTASHLNYMERNYWKSSYSISFPRIRPCEGSITPKSNMSDKQLVQLICAYRIFNQQVELSLSTRESPKFRDNVLSLGITNMSAASKTQPGGYASNQEELEQFAISDERSALIVADSIMKAGLHPVWTDWDKVYSGK
ncbi:2-iminoacetate synthase ThiH [Vibrio sp. MA40-2]|uniref:2-iminoacetate synthase ThiH n=1 Tax=Vibrio sp. MA40-2 TaxID=3391828 RepID=UPI0039A4527C